LYFLLVLKVGTQTTFSFDGEYSCGLGGKIAEIPAGFVHSTLLFAGKGVRNTFTQWGDFLLQKSGKQRTTPQTTNGDSNFNDLTYYTEYARLQQQHFSYSVLLFTQQRCVLLLPNGARVKKKLKNLSLFFFPFF
jgi:hypothetical protein